jgi:NAD+ synthase
MESQLQLRINCFEAEKKIIKFIDKAVKNANQSGAIVAVSGGIDSAVTLSLTVKALGPNKVTALHLPERDITPNHDTEDVMLHCKKLNITCNTLDITPMLKGIKKGLANHEKLNQTAEGNLKSRLRMIIAYYFANTKKRIVIGTSNKTELMTGFFTKYGDGGVDLIPLGDLYKTQIIQLAKFLNIPQRIIEKPPSPGFYPGQTDEEELGFKYSILDLILLSWEKGNTNEKISSMLNLDIKIIQSLEARIRINEHKRRFPLILRLSET